MLNFPNCLTGHIPRLGLALSFPMIYFLMRERIDSRDEEAVILGRFDDWKEVEAKARQESDLEENKGYRIYIHATSDATRQRPPGN